MDNPHTADAQDSALVMDLLDGFRRSAVLLAATQLGIFDALAYAAISAATAATPTAPTHVAAELTTAASPAAAAEEGLATPCALTKVAVGCTLLLTPTPCGAWAGLTAQQLSPLLQRPLSPGHLSPLAQPTCGHSPQPPGKEQACCSVDEIAQCPTLPSACASAHASSTMGNADPSTSQQVQKVCGTVATSSTAGSTTGSALDGLTRLLDACVALHLLLRHDPASPPDPSTLDPSSRTHMPADTHDTCHLDLDASPDLSMRYSPSGYRYSLSPVAAAYLTTSSATSLCGYVNHSSRVVYPLFGGLAHSAHTGEPAWGPIFGLAGADVFSHMYRSPDQLLSFLRGMHSFAALSARAVLTAVDLSWVRTAADFGGATGALATAAIQLSCEWLLHPDLRVTVVDLPPVIAAAKASFLDPPYVPEPLAAAVRERVTWLSSDLFGPCIDVPAELDLVIMARILHDWHPPAVAQLLRLAHRKLRAGGALLLAEMLLEASGVAPERAVLQSLNMLVQTKGRERSLAEYALLCREAGFGKVQGCVTGSYLDAVIAYKDC